MRAGPVLSADITGTEVLDATFTFPVYGRFESTKWRSRLLLAVDGLNGAVWERLVIDGKVQTRASGAWATQDAPPPTEDLAAALAGITDVTDLGPEMLDGRPGRHLQTNLHLTSDVFGAVIVGGSTVATLDAHVRADGSPVTLGLKLDIWDLTLTVRRTPPVVGGPAEVRKHAAKALGYSLSIPTDWKVEPAASEGEWFTSAFDDAAVRSFCRPSTLDLAGWAGDGVEYYAKAWHADPTTTTRTVVGADGHRLDAVVTDWSGTVDGAPTSIVNVAVVGTAHSCDWQLFNEPGQEPFDHARLIQLLGSLSLA
jgi:hypothetical protein